LGASGEVAGEDGGAAQTLQTGQRGEMAATEHAQACGVHAPVEKRLLIHLEIWL